MSYLRIFSLAVVMCGTAEFLSSCSTEGREAIAMVSVVAVAAPLMPVAEAYHSVFGVRRGLLIPDVYRLKPGVYVLSNDGGWFTKGRARYGGDGTAHICLSAWVVDLENELKDKSGSLILSKDNLEEFFWEQHPVDSLQKLHRGKNGAHSPEYFIGNENQPIVVIVVGPKSYTLKLKQDGPD